MKLRRIQEQATESLASESGMSSSRRDSAHVDNKSTNMSLLSKEIGVKSIRTENFFDRNMNRINNGNQRQQSSHFNNASGSGLMRQSTPANFAAARRKPSWFNNCFKMLCNGEEEDIS